MSYIIFLLILFALNLVNKFLHIYIFLFLSHYIPVWSGLFHIAGNQNTK
jgi:hypothetical protein